MPIIQCDIREGRTAEQKRALAAPGAKGEPGHAR
jgi:hypothetical protein